ncbi:MAG: hypothetical protein AAFQ91_04205 [Cyanobacteria bacterium J06621_15]
MGWDNQIAHLSSDANILVTGGIDDQKISVWDLITGQLIRCWMFAPDEFLHGMSNTVESLAVGADNRILVSGGRLIQVWDLPTGRKIRTLRATGAICNTISPDGTKLITHGSGRTPTTIVWDLHRGKKIYQRTKEYYSLLSFVISPDSKTFIGGDNIDNNIVIKIWDLNTGETLKTIENQGAIRVQRFAISPNGLLIVGAGYDGIKIWEIKTGKQVQRVDKFKNVRFHNHLDYVRNAVFSTDSNMLLSSGSDDSIQVWNVKTGKNIYTFPEKLLFTSVLVSLDGQTIVGHSGNKVKVWKNVSS